MDTYSKQMDHYWKYALAGTAVLLLGAVALASAQTLPPGTTSPPLETPISAPAAGQYPAPQVVDIDNSGYGLIRGIVESAGTDAVTVSTWGGTWTIRTGTTGTVIPAGAGGASDLSAVQVGHFIGAEGTVASDQPETLNATLVRDWTTDPYTGPLLNTGPTGIAPTFTPGVGGEGDASGTGTGPTNPLIDTTEDTNSNTDDDADIDTGTQDSLDDDTNDATNDTDTIDTDGAEDADSDAGTLNDDEETDDTTDDDITPTPGTLY